nr:uroporphyrinogen decarboxylase [Chloroflexota bacterium]
MSHAGPTTIDPPRPWTGERRFLAACRREPVDATPIWFMRQAGRASPGYAELVERHGVMGITTDPDLATRVALLPVEAFGVDAAILYADIMLPLGPMGVAYALTPQGPVLERPIRSAEDVRGLRQLEPTEDLPFILETVASLRAALDGRCAVIGLAGGPFTMAAYLIEGGPSRDQLTARAFMHAEPAAWHDLLGRLADATAAYLRAQVAAGAQAVQLFDSWAGSLAPSEYEAFVAPYARRSLSASDGVPTIHFATGAAPILAQMAAAGGDVLGVDHRQPLGDAWARLADRAIQGNLDGARLLAGRGPMEEGASAVLDQAAG